MKVQDALWVEILLDAPRVGKVWQSGAETVTVWAEVWHSLVVPLAGRIGTGSPRDVRFY